MFDLGEYQQRLNEAVEFLRGAMQPFPRIGIIAGTGLGDVVGAAREKGVWPYQAIPNFPVSTVKSHGGRLVHAMVSGREVVVLQGRFHLYEGYAPWEVVFPIRVLAKCGMKALIVTNAAGGLNLGFRRGDLMLIRDHINMSGENPLAGPHDDGWGPRFPDMTRAYDPVLGQLAKGCATTAGITLREGVYVAVKGPSLETPAETRFFRQAGADAIGMSTVQEVIAGVQAGLRILGFSVITNVNDPDRMAPVQLEDVIRAANGAAPFCARLIQDVVGNWPAEGG
ncbi:MAG: purine-nucleoside phosphorylase [Lentisphaerae bacterium RIFOXYB12_FULL_65_16]|nr:MAG: purine-nucleoside phosphorylase [Lentisphaerae bacterium RIFOXYA12_64_32]OGV89370.1 MAG: purine-nucleoside phosphorylase [Lentisphaerae bacterium RIFOXYB12_FULL_65_16]